MEKTIPDVATEKKTRDNLLSVSIVLLGLFVGSVFVDIVQLATGSGFSKRITSATSVIETNGKTWVAYSDPKIFVDVVTDSSCETCDPSKALLWIRRILPTVVINEIPYDSFDGQKLAAELSIRSLPAFVFSKEITETSFYAQASELFSELGGKFVFDMTKIGQAPGKFLELPEIRPDTTLLGSKDDFRLTIIEYSDFECPYCKLFHSSVEQMLKEYSGDIRFVYKHLPLSFHPQAENAALASECANDEGKFLPYSDILFAKQDEWEKTTGTVKFKEYARTLRLNMRNFNTCLDTKKHLEKIQQDTAEAKEFGISGTPGIFVGDTFVGGAISYDELKSLIDKKLSK